MLYDWSADEKRRQEHRDHRIAYEAQIRLNDSGELDGEWGRYVWRNGICRLFHPGTPQEGNREGARRRVMAKMVRGDFPFIRRLVSPQTMAYRRATEVGGPLAESPAWRYLQQASSFHAANVQKLEYSLALGCGPVRVAISHHGKDSTRYYPPSAECVAPENVTALPAPNNRMAPMVVFQHNANGTVTVWDISDPDFPRWEDWRSVREWNQAHDGMRVYRGALLREQNGPAYPWWYRDEPIIPWDLLPGSFSATDLTALAGTVQPALMKVLRDAWLDWLMHVGSYDRAIVAADCAILGFDQSLIDPSNMLVLTPDENGSDQGKQGVRDVKIIPNASQTVQRYRQIESELTLQAMQTYQSGFYYEDGGKNESGFARQLRMSGMWQFRAQQIEHVTPHDRQLLKAIVATWNWLVQAGGIRGYIDPDGEVILNPQVSPGNTELLIPEVSDSQIKLRHPVRWEQGEIARLLAEKRDAIAIGAATRVDYWLLERELEDNEANRALALETLEKYADEEVKLARRGLGVPAVEIWKAEREAPVTADAQQFEPGERVRVKGEPHMPGQSEGVVATSTVTETLSIVFDGDQEPHKWYVANEVSPA